jgi:hypothetical protein
MKNLLLISMIISFLVSCNPAQKEQVAEVMDEGIVTEMPTLTVDEFDVTAGQFVDKEIAISGIVDHVCKHSGKKLKLVTDGGSVHVDSETRFDDALVGQEIELTGIVRELRVDESYCLQMEEDNTKKHRSGEMNEEQLGSQHKMIQHYRDSMKVAGVDHLSFYTIEYVALDKKSE